MLFRVTSTALPWDFYFFKLTQPLTVQLGYTVKKQGRKPDRKPFPLSYGLRYPYRNLKSENSQKPQQNGMFMNLASGINLTNTCLCFFFTATYIYYSKWLKMPLAVLFISNWSEKLLRTQLLAFVVGRYRLGSNCHTTPHVSPLLVSC